MAQIKVTALLLAAGLSHRMGAQNKLLLSYKGKSLVRYQYDLLRAVEKISNVQVVLGHEAALIRRQLPSGASVSINQHYHKGLSSSIQNGLEHIPESHAFMISLADMPLLTSSIYQQLVQHYIQTKEKNIPLIVSAAYQKKSRPPILFSPDFRKTVQSHHAPDGCKAIVQDHRSFLHLIEGIKDRELFDIDTPQDYINLIHKV